MSYKTILVHVSESKHAPEYIKMAANIANQYEAHLVGLAATALPNAFYLPGVLTENTALTAYLQYLRERAEGAMEVFEAICQQTDVASYERRIVEQEASASLSLHARCSDLAVIGQLDPEESLPAIRADFAQYSVMNTGRPVLIVPYGRQFTTVGKRIIIGWDGSMEASRAITSALPFLQQAESVLLSIFTSKADTDIPDDQTLRIMSPYLARHGVNVEVLRKKLPAGVSTGEALLTQGTGFNADLMVVGGYGHSRFREVMLGGATQTILNGMQLPTLMSH